MTRRRLLWAAVSAFYAGVANAAGALAATPGATRPVGNDPRSPGEGPGLVGDPLFAIGIVVLIGIAAVVLTIVYLRLTSTDRPAA